MFPCNIGGHAAYQDFGLTEIFISTQIPYAGTLFQTWACSKNSFLHASFLPVIH